MPELPEVETVRRHLHDHLPGQRITQVTLRRPNLRYPIPVEAIQALGGRTVASVRRRAKYLLLDCGADVALVHLGMTGRLFVEPDVGDDAFRPHEHWRWLLDGPRGPQRLRYVDARRFGALDAFQAAQEPGHALLSTLGPEPLDEKAFTAGHLHDSLQRSRVGVKVLLMDAHRVVGVGNIYASEACFRAGVHPGRPGQDVTAAECERLVEAVRDVLHEAIAAGGSTLRDFAGGDEAPGYFQQRLDVYDRKGEGCHRCPGTIERVVMGQRATFFCGKCQR